MDMLVPIFVLVTCLAAVYGSDESIFPVNQEFEYLLRGDVSVGTADPASALSHFGIQAKLHIQTSQNKAIFKLDDVEYSVYNGPGTRSKLPAYDYNFIALPKDSESITKPFSASYKGGQVTNFEVESSDVIWSRNIKRALVSQFQLTLDHITKNTTTPNAYVTNESGMNGNCHVHNLVKYDQDKNEFELRKFIETSSCSEVAHKMDYSAAVCGTDPEKNVHSSTERRYTLTNDNGNLVIELISSRSAISFQPFEENGEVQYHVTRQTIKRLSSGPLKSSISLTEPLTSTSLIFELPPASKDGSDYDMTFGKQKKNSEEIVPRIVKLLQSVAETLYNQPDKNVAGKIDELHDISLYHIIVMLRQLGNDGIRQVVESNLLGTSYLDETARSILLKTLAKVGTHASIQVTVELINEGKISSSSANSLLDNLPFYLRNVSPKILEDTKVLLHLNNALSVSTKRAAVLTYATLIGNVCQATKCETSVIDEHVRYFFTKLRESEEYQDQMLYLEAMGNIKLRQVVEYLEPIIRGHLGYSHHLRFLAAMATKSILKSQPEKVYEIYWPILADRREHLELRSIAVSMLLSSQPTSERFLNILWFMTAEPSVVLYHFYYTTVQSMIDTSFPCYMHLSSDAAKLAKLIPKSQIETEATGNFIADYTHPKLVYGNLWHTMLIGDEDTGVPNVINLEYITKSFEWSSYEFKIYLKLQGVSHELDKQDLVKLESPENALQEILKSIKITPKEHKPIHIEIILKKQDRTVTCLFINETMLNALKTVFTKVGVTQDYHSNFQSLELILMTESLRPSDIGIGVTIEQSGPSILSLRGNVTVGIAEASLIRHVNMDMRLNRQINYNIRNYNPFGGILQGISRSHSYQTSVPISSIITLDMSQKSIKFRSDWEEDRQFFSYVQHYKTESFSVGRYSRNVLSQTCPNCQIKYLASKGKNYRKNKNLKLKNFMSSQIELQINLFDCEVDTMIENKLETWQSIFSSKGKNTRAFPNFGPIMRFAMAFDSYPITSFEGSCGLKVMVNLIGRARSNEIVFKMEEPTTGRYLLRALQTLKDSSNKLILSWDTNVIVETDKTSENQLAIKAKITRQAPGENVYMICMKSDNKYPDFKSPWDLLYNPDEIKETRHSFAIEFGDTELGTCPGSGTQIAITGVSKTQKFSNTHWPFAQCEKDKGDSKYYPASSACVQTMLKRKSASDFSFNVNQINLSPKTKSLFSHINTIQYALTSKVSEIPHEFTVNMKETEDNGIEVHLDTRDGSSVDYSHILPESLAEEIPCILSTFAEYPSARTIAMSMDLTAVCAVAGSKLMTYDNSTIDWQRSTKQKLLSADCGTSPLFGIFGSNPEGSESLDLEAYILNDKIEIKQDSTDSVKVIMNGVSVEDGHDSDGLKIKQRETGVQINHGDIDLFISYTPRSVAIIINQQYKGMTCGLCGDYNDEPEHSGSYPGPHGPISDVKTLFEAYTIPENKIA